VGPRPSPRPVLGEAARTLECEVAIHVARHYDVPGATRPRCDKHTARTGR
jgi:hypothetical protein